MPCRDYYDERPDTTRIDAANKKIKAQQKRLDMYARLLCFVCTNTDLDNILHQIMQYTHVTDEDKKNHKELLAWWAEHQELDRKEQERVAAETAKREALRKEEARKAAIKARALKKLSAAEREVLGLS